jgi:hypothetical protein
MCRTWNNRLFSTGRCWSFCPDPNWRVIGKVGELPGGTLPHELDMRDDILSCKRGYSEVVKPGGMRVVYF